MVTEAPIHLMLNSVAIMQPYVFPYLGYFCLVQASDVFVFYDDVNFITRGWINRNRILLNGEPFKFTISVSHASQNDLICDVRVHALQNFKKRFLKQIEQAYHKAPYFAIGYEYIDRILQPTTVSIAELAISSVVEFYQLIGIEKKFVRSSEHFTDNRGMDKADRLIQITKRLGSKHYLNAIGGMELYDKSYFAKNDVQLSFVNTGFPPYQQTGAREFVPGLSIIDIIMNNDIAAISHILESFELS